MVVVDGPRTPEYPYSWVWGNYGITIDPVTGLSALYLQALSNNYEGKFFNSITEAIGRWDINLRLNDSESNFFGYYLSTDSINLISGYGVRLSTVDGLAALVSIDENSNETILLSTPISDLNAVHTLSMELDDEGNFEFMVDDVSVGTINDTTYMSFGSDWLIEWSGNGLTTAYINWIQKDGKDIVNFNNFLNSCGLNIANTSGVNGVLNLANLVNSNLNISNESIVTGIITVATLNIFNVSIFVIKKPSTTIQIKKPSTHIQIKKPHTTFKIIRDT